MSLTNKLKRSFVCKKKKKKKKEAKILYAANGNCEEFNYSDLWFLIESIYNSFTNENVLLKKLTLA